MGEPRCLQAGVCQYPGACQWTGAVLYAPFLLYVRKGTSDIMPTCVAIEQSAALPQEALYL